YQLLCFTAQKSSRIVVTTMVFGDYFFSGVFIGRNALPLGCTEFELASLGKCKLLSHVHVRASRQFSRDGRTFEPSSHIFDFVAKGLDDGLRLQSVLDCC
ncbi:MAG: hypothetical protein KC777_24375, partial [Cyanobacteria bacterium HKST-UBA02]|nr:hypothetical protein [Cyanobacteria bacterium HKST-UBA02]